jgi:hypothetical protein
MTASSVALGNTAVSVDLRSASTATYGTDARKTVGSVRALWAGNATVNNNLRYTGAANDRDPILQAIGGATPTASVPGYAVTDVNLDGTTKYTGSANDRDPILLNIGGSVPTTTRTEQLP